VSQPTTTVVTADGGPVLHRRISGLDVDLLVSPDEFDALVDQTMSSTDGS
jgi:hypothetical protein